MNTSLSWVKAYVPELDVTAQEYTDAMTLTGTKVEGFEKLDADLGWSDREDREAPGCRQAGDLSGECGN